MKRNIAVLGLIVCFALMAGCATTHQIPTGCEKSLIHKYYPWADTMLSGAVLGAYALAGTNPELYVKIQDGAKLAISLLEGTAVTYGELSKVPNIYMLITSQLASIFRPGDLIDACDKAILIGYLKMI